MLLESSKFADVNMESLLNCSSAKVRYFTNDEDLEEISDRQTITELETDLLSRLATLEPDVSSHFGSNFVWKTVS